MARTWFKSRRTDGVFISYRRRGSGAGYVGRLSDRLADRFGEDRIFRDVDTIQLGQDFAQSIAEAVGSSRAFLAVIDGEWLTVTDAQGNRRLDNPQDYVRLEIEAALERAIPVIPVLVDGTPMPSGRDLPESLEPLARRHALELGDSRADFEADFQRLADVLERSGVRRGRGGQRDTAVGWGWWLLPVFFNIIGGIAAWLSLRRRDPRLARGMLVVGGLVTVLFGAVLSQSVTPSSPSPTSESTFSILLELGQFELGNDFAFALDGQMVDRLFVDASAPRFEGRYRASPGVHVYELAGVITFADGTFCQASGSGEMTVSEGLVYGLFLDDLYSCTVSMRPLP